MDRDTRLDGLREELVILDDKISEIRQRMITAEGEHLADLECQIDFLEQDREVIEEEYFTEIDAEIDDIIRSHEKGMTIY